ncbi:MAG: zinc ribbon domain-containing protein [Bryobacteraceae bacterium]
MPERCTCGAQLPEDALFCHKCGKPQRELVAVDEPEVVPAPPPIPVVIAPPLAPAINFHNGTAVRIALGMGVMAFMCLLVVGQLALPQVLIFVWLAAAGFLAVYLYRRSTGQRLSMINGARLGWISGIFGFVIVTIILTVFVIALSEPSVVTALREQIKTRGIPEANLDQMIEALHSPAGITSALGLFFLLFTVLPAFGGAVGAKLLDRD